MGGRGELIRKIPQREWRVKNKTGEPKNLIKGKLTPSGNSKRKIGGKRMGSISENIQGGSRKQEKKDLRMYGIMWGVRGNLYRRCEGRRGCLRKNAGSREGKEKAERALKVFYESPI